MPSLFGFFLSKNDVVLYRLAHHSMLRRCKLYHGITAQDLRVGTLISAITVWFCCIPAVGCLGLACLTVAHLHANSGNLLGTVRSLDNVGVIPLNCTQNRDIFVHNESLHCAWGLVSRDG